MRYPGFLQPGGRIGFIAPSFGAAAEPYKTRFRSAAERFRSEGFTIVKGPNCFSACGTGKSNTPEACASEINDFFLNDRSDVIISCGGGETMCEDIPFVDFEAISKAKPKWFMGYSDNTNLTFTLPLLADTAAIYGPCAGAFGMRKWHESVSDAFDLLKGRKLEVHNYAFWEKESAETGDLLASYNATEAFSMRSFIPGGKNEARFTGRLLGGCIDCLSVLCGTEFDKVKEFSDRYREDGIIWFMEACELGPMGIRRALWQFENAGWFENVKGFIFGRPMMMDAPGMGLDRFTAVTGILEKYGVPVLCDVDLGHLPPMMPVISGAAADVSAYGNHIEIRHILK